MNRDPRPIWRQVLSGLKIAALIVGCGVAVYIFASFIPIARIEAYFWHLRHGNSIRVGRYSVPVPKQWYVANASDHDVLLVDLNTGDSMAVTADILSKHFTLPAWSDIMNHPLPGDKMKPTGHREFRVAGEAFFCIEEDVDIEIAHGYPITCRSEGGVEVTFQPYINVGRGHQQAFYALLQQIRKL